MAHAELRQCSYTMVCVERSGAAGLSERGMLSDESEGRVVYILRESIGAMLRERVDE
jgi:hypothetical protein